MSSKTTTKEAGASRTGRRYDETFKRDAVRLRQQTGRPRAQVARDLGVSEVSLSAWEVVALAEVARLRAELEHMTRQRDILKKAMAIMGQDQKSTSR
jgi:transposase